MGEGNGVEDIGFGIAGACGVPHSSFAPIQTCNPLQYFERGVAQGVLPTTWAVWVDDVSSFSSEAARIHVPCSCDRRSGEGSDSLAPLCPKQVPHPPSPLAGALCPHSAACPNPMLPQSPNPSVRFFAVAALCLPCAKAGSQAPAGVTGMDCFTRDEATVFPSRPSDT